MSDPPTNRCSPLPPVRTDGTPPEFAPEWRTETVLMLAVAIRAGTAFDRMPILADALEDAGCSDPLVLNHCRFCAQHTPGCWVIEHLAPVGELHWTGDLKARLAAAVADAAKQGTANPTAASGEWLRATDRWTSKAMIIVGRVGLAGLLLLLAAGLIQMLFFPVVEQKRAQPTEWRPSEVDPSDLRHFLRSPSTGTAPASPSRGPPSPPR